MRGGVASLGIAAALQLSACDAGTPSPTAERVPPRVPFTDAQGEGPAPGCSLPSFTLIDVDAAIPWRCFLDQCSVQAVECADDCPCNTAFTQAVECLAGGGEAGACLLLPNQESPDNAVTSFTQCFAVEQKACLLSDAGSMDAATLADAEDATAGD
jgi:hypothetical protein